MTNLFLIARISGRTVAINSDQVDSVVDIAEIVPVPKSPAQVSGLAALRSRVVTVINTCAALGLPSCAGCNQRAVITRADGHHYAILVDALEDVAPFALSPMAGGIAIEGGWAEAACGVVNYGGDAVLAIDLRALIPGNAAAA